MIPSSTPTLTEFDPHAVPYQFEVIRDVRSNFNYNSGIHQILLSGSVGSAKSLLVAHIAVTHCLLFPGAHFGIGRRSMPDLRATLHDLILNHLGDDVDYELNQVTGRIRFANGSKITPHSWADGKFKKIRSQEFTGFAVEELTENEGKEFYTEMLMRVGRLEHVPEKIVINATNPDDPEHWAYKHFIESKNPNVHVYYSRTRENPFLPKGYISELERNLDPKMALRMLEGQWLPINREVIYYGYSKEAGGNYRAESYVVDPQLPVEISFDFNIGHGKPMSACLYQYSKDQFHFFADAVVHGADTADIMEEIASRGHLEHNTRYFIHGDASGKHRDTRSKRSDYDIIDQYLSKYVTRDGRKLMYQMQVPLANPPVRTRHNTVNSYLKNAKGQVRLFVYEGADVLDEGFRLTKLKPGGQYIEDDKPYYQHVTTAAGYGVLSTLTHFNRKPQGTRIL